MTMETELSNQDQQAQQTEENVKLEAPKKKTKTCYLHTALLPFIFWIIFSALFYFFAYDLADIKYTAITNAKVSTIFKTYGIYTGIALGFISMLGGYITYFILKKTKITRFSFVFPLLVLVMKLPWYFLARQFVYFEKNYTDLGRGIIFYIGHPLLSTTKFLFWLFFLWLLIETILFIIQKKQVNKVATTMALCIMPLFLTGCVGTINEWACQFYDNPDHCLQNAAIQDADASTCEKIKGEDFSDSGSNPPKDKCYLRIAENTGDLSACDKIEGGMYSYTKEECILSTAVKFENPSGCAMLTGKDKSECASQVGPKIDPGSVIDMDDQIIFLKNELKNNPDEDLQKQLNDLEKRRADYLGVMTNKNKKDYESMTDPLNKQASVDYYTGKIDEKTKDALVALNDSLRVKGEKMTEKEYKAISDMLAYKNDPKNNIENMDDTEIVKLRWNEKVGNAVESVKFWKSNPTEAEKKYDEQLFFYQRMLERQAAIEKGLSEKQQDFERNADTVKEFVKGKAWDAAMDAAEKEAFGELLDVLDSSASAPVTAILGEAIDTVKQEAQSAEFRGLVRAYDKGMEEELGKAGGDVNKAHAAVVANLQKDAYTYEDKNTFAKYGNILENKDCDGSNPHCISRDVFWKAMKKSYQYQQK